MDAESVITTMHSGPFSTLGMPVHDQAVHISTLTSVGHVTLHVESSSLPIGATHYVLMLKL